MGLWCGQDDESEFRHVELQVTIDRSYGLCRRHLEPLSWHGKGTPRAGIAGPKGGSRAQRADVLSELICR